MTRDVLFLLKENFEDGPGTAYFCPDCAYINGLLSYFPRIRHNLDVRYVDFPRPRTEIIDLIGPEFQGCPMLVLGADPGVDSAEFGIGQSNGRFFISGAKKIAQYWSQVYGISRPH